MKILMFNNEFPPLGGGTGTVNLELFNIFKDLPEINIDLISSASGNEKEIEQFSDNIRIIKYPVKKKNIHHASNLELIRYALKASRAGFIYHKKEKYDLVFTWTTVPSGLPAILLKRFKKLPYIVRIGGPDIPGFEKRYKFIYKLISPLIKKIWKKAEVLTVKCNTERAMIKTINKNLEVRTIYNGIDTQKFKPKTKTNPKGSNLSVICSARLIKRKGQYTLIDATEKLKSEGIIININLVGEGDETNAYKEYVKNKNLKDQIKFSGYVPREKMNEKYQQADIFVLASYNEGMSNSLLEAMACGLPAVVTKVGGTEELVDQTNGYTFDPGDSSRLAEIIKSFALNKEQISSLGKSSRKKAETFKWQKIAEEYIELFKKNCKSA